MNTYLDNGYSNLLHTSQKDSNGINEGNTNLIGDGVIGYIQTSLGKLSPKQDIQSKDFITGESGWRIRGDGGAEFSNVVVRGTVYADSGIFSGEIVGASINIPDATTPLFSVDTSGNVVANSLRRNDFHWYTLFEGIDGFSPSGSGVASVSGGGLILQTGATNDNDLYVYKELSSSGGLMTWAKKRVIRAIFSYTDTVVYQSSHVTTGTITRDDLNGVGFGFYISGTSLFAIVGDGGTHTKTTVETITHAVPKLYTASFVPGDGVYFYRENTQIGHITTDLPAAEDSGASILFNAGIKTHTGQNRKMNIASFEFWQEF